MGVVPYYQDDLVTLYHGDCLQLDDWLNADVLVTDPPYGVEWKAGSLNDKKAIRDLSVQSIAADEDTIVRDKVIEAWGSKPSVVFGSWRKPLHKQPTHRLIWHKAGRQPGITSAPFFPNDEEIWLSGSGWQGTPPLATVVTTTEQRGKQPMLIGHPTPKPVSLMELLISRCPQGIIAEPFAGSGATVLACRNLNRKVIAVELEKKYCDLIVSRLAQQVFDLGGLQ